MAGEGWKEALLQEADAAEIPVFYGGTATGPDGDPKCEHAIRYGGDIPLSIYFQAQGRHERILPDGAELTSLNIPRSRAVRIRLPVLQAGSRIFWFWETASAHDLGFGLYFQSGDPVDGQEISTAVEGHDWEMVVPYFRLLTHAVPEWDAHSAQRTGTYVVVFDNSYSWLNSKDISYFLSVEPPDSTRLDRIVGNHNLDRCFGIQA